MLIAGNGRFDGPAEGHKKFKMYRVRLLLSMAFVFGLLLTAASGRSQILIDLTNHVWRYTQTPDDPGAFWLPEFEDALWDEGRGVFAYEESTGAALMTNLYPYTNTILLQPSASGITVVYFRTHFLFSGGDPNKFVLVASNLIDDGYVMYLNGEEVDRYNMHPNDQWAALAQPGEGKYVVRPLSAPPGLLAKGDNVLAVRVHQNVLNSSDVVWGTVLHASPAPASFQDGAGGYNSMQDTELHQGNPTADLGQNQTIAVDLADPAPNETQGLLRFDWINGGSPGQIPFGSIVTRAVLRLHTDDVTDATTPVRLVRMLVPWEESSTWESMAGGINETNGVETERSAVLIDGSQADAFDDIDVTAAVQAWANGEPNLGWALLATGSNGWDFASSENGIVANRPKLLVDFLPVPETCRIVHEPDSVTVDEKRSFTLRVVSRGTDLTYQWYKGDVAIPGATADTHSVSWAVPADSGDYHVVVQNEIILPVNGASLLVCTSATAVVTVNADLKAPVLTSALGNPNQSTITLTFNDTMDPASAGNPTNYSLSGGLNISSAAVDGKTVTLTTDPARAVGTDYTLTITGVHDDAVALNRLDPITTNLAQQVRFLAFDATWKFDTNGLDRGTAWKDPAYEDRSWPEAPALLGYETGASTLASLERQGLNTNNATLWPLTNAGGTQTITYYLRGNANIPFDLTGATLTLRHVIDDGAVVHFNGEERFRFNMPDGPVDYLTEAIAAPAEGLIRTATLTNIDCGHNLIAVSLHNDSPSSTDILFAAELLATFTSFQPCAGNESTLSIINDAGAITLSWSPPGGTLEESTNLINWSQSPDQNNPQIILPSIPAKFYRVR